MTGKEADTQAAETKIQKLVEQFVKQYKDKVSMDELYLLLVNHVRVNSGMSQPFYISGVNRSPLVQKDKQLESLEESGDGEVEDRGHGVRFKNKDEKTKRDNYSRGNTEWYVAGLLIGCLGVKNNSIMVI